jgi:hypothetical protein
MFFFNLKNKSHKIDIMQLFSVEATMFSKPENLKKPSSKVAHNRPKNFHYWPRNRYPVPPKAP